MNRLLLTLVLTLIISNVIAGKVWDDTIQPLQDLSPTDQKFIIIIVRGKLTLDHNKLMDNNSDAVGKSRT